MAEVLGSREAALGTSDLSRGMNRQKVQKVDLRLCSLQIQLGAALIELPETGERGKGYNDVCAPKQCDLSRPFFHLTSQIRKVILPYNDIMLS